MTDEALNPEARKAYKRDLEIYVRTGLQILSPNQSDEREDDGQHQQRVSEATHCVLGEQSQKPDHK
jgi:hypothetical protein